MPTVHIPSLLRDLTAGRRELEVDGTSVREILDNLERSYPGLKARILGVERLKDWDRMASLATSDTTIAWDEAKGLGLDAYASFSDEMAFGVLWAARERGLSVPGDLSVVGVDDHDGAPVVGLTTVHQDVA